MRSWLTVLAVLLLPSMASATEMGLPTAGFHKANVDFRIGFAGDSSMYLLHDQTNIDLTYEASFATFGGVAALGLWHRVELNGGAGIAGFNGYQETVGEPDGTYKFYTGGVRVTFFDFAEGKAQFGGGAQAAWWNHDNLIASGERTAVLGGSYHPFEGSVFYGGVEYFNVGMGAPVTATVSSQPVSLVGDGEAIYGGYRGRLAIFILQIEGRIEVPDPSRHGLGAMAGLEF